MVSGQPAQMDRLGLAYLAINSKVPSLQSTASLKALGVLVRIKPRYKTRHRFGTVHCERGINC